MDHDLQLDGLPGPTFHFGGLSAGNIASAQSAGLPANPALAARQAINKMRVVHRLGGRQAFLPPLDRPDIQFLRSVGFSGSDAEVLHNAASAPTILSMACSSAYMFAANCATVIPSGDADDRRCHIVPANLVALAHRSRETEARTMMLRRMFASNGDVKVHDALPAAHDFADEGAANHARLTDASRKSVAHLFVYGRSSERRAKAPERYPARQTRAACEAVSRIGQVQSRSVFAQATPASIDAGAFHADLTMISHLDRMVLHKNAFVSQAATLKAVKQRVPTLTVFEVPPELLSLKEAVKCYFFNSQLITDEHGDLVMLSPSNCDAPRPRKVLARLVNDGVIARSMFVDLEGSMRNGGGPACLRLRLPLSLAESAFVTRGLVLDDSKLDALEGWVGRHYRDVLRPEDLGDVELLHESRVALDELTQIFGLGSWYSFQA